MSGEILQRIAERLQAATAPAMWGFLAPVAGVRKLAFTDSVILDALGQEFTSEELESARVLVRRQGGQFEPNPVLVGECAQGLFLRRTKDEAPFDVVNQNGSLTSDDPPAFSCSRDYFTQRWVGDSKSILVAFSDDDLAVLRMLSLPCTTSAGLAAMNGEQLRRLYAARRISQAARRIKFDR